MTLSEMINVAFKLSDQINFLWNFFVVFSAFFLGWVLSTSMSWDNRKRGVLIILFAIFSLINSNALSTTYLHLALALDDIAKLIKAQGETPSPFLSEFVANPGLGPMKSRLVHYTADLLIIFLIIKSTRKKELAEKGSSIN